MNEQTEDNEKKDQLTPFDFLNSVSHGKNELILTADQPEYIEKQYNPFIVNRGLSNFPDSILHVNEMNMRHNLPKDAQYRYYLNVLRKRKRFTKWPKIEKNPDLDLIQEYYKCRREVAKQYLKALSREQLDAINNSMSKGGAEN